MNKETRTDSFYAHKTRKLIPTLDASEQSYAAGVVGFV